MADLGVAVQRARQGWRFEHGNLVLGAQLADLGGHHVGALGQHARRAALLLGVAQRHRIVRRVGDDHVRLGHVGHHAALGRLALHGADAALELRVAFGLAVLLAHLFLGHAVLAGVLPQRQRHIHRRHQQHHAGHAQEGHAGHVHGVAHAGNQVLARQLHEVIAIVQDQPPADAAHQHQLGQQARQLQQPLHGKHALETVHPDQPGDVGCQRLEGNRPARQRQRRQRRQHQHQDQPGQHHGERAELGADVLPLLLRAGVVVAVELQAARQERRRRPHDRLAHHPQPERAGRQQDERDQLPRLGNVAFLARLLEAPR